jgi:Holliday junction resolvase
MNAKRKGNRNEHRSIALLESAGYRCSRSAASLGDWDVIGVGPADIVLVQVKTRDWPGREEMERLRAFPAPANCRKLVHRWQSRKRTPDVRELEP